jgi:AraC-type DNA-binding domain-containing proteins
MDVYTETAAPDRYSGMGNNQTDFEACYNFTAQGTYAWGSHCHDFYELYIHLGGGHFYGLDNSVYEMQPNQLFMAPPFAMHGLVVEQNLIDYERAFLYISTDTLKRAGCGQFDFDRFFQSLAASGSYQFAMRPDDAEKCKNLLISLKENQQKNDSLSRFRDYSMLLPILDLMCETMTSSAPLQQVHIENSAIYDIFVYINTHYTETIKLDKLARSGGVSLSYLSHEFKKYTNRSVYDYVLYRRVMMAKKLIPHCSSMFDVSEQCGFENYSNFLRLFHKYTGMSPSAYKKSLTQSR